MTDTYNPKEGGFNPTAFIISLVSYVAFLALLYFMTITYQPPEEEIALGVDLNYGVDLVGSGSLQTLNRASDSPDTREMAPPKESVAKKSTPAVETKPTVNPSPSKTSEVRAVAKTPPVITSNAEKTPSLSDQPAKASPSKSVTPTPAPAPPTRKVDNGSLYNKGSSGSSSGGNGTVGTVSGKGGNNNGTGGGVGDMGDPKGTVDGKSLYGTPGAGGGSKGATVSISGWRNKAISLPKDNSSETGKIVFRVTVDDTGDVVGIQVVESSVSPSVVGFYRNYLQQKLSTFLVAEGNPPPRSTGTITIQIRSGN